MCTGTHGGSETSLNTVVHENVKVYKGSSTEIATIKWYALFSSIEQVGKKFFS